MGTWGDEPGVIRLPDGRLIRGTGLRHARGDVPRPEFAVLLLRRNREVAWPARWVQWRDFGLPRFPDDALAVLREAHARAAIERVEIACHGGIGRTGTALAVLAVLSGCEPEHAVQWVRTQYHRKAVETRRQRRWVEAQAR